jgi:hypothetical protein
METMFAASDLLGRLLAAVVLAAVTGLAVALLAQLAGKPVRVSTSYVDPNQFESRHGGHLVSGRIVDPSVIGFVRTRLAPGGRLIAV